MPGPSNTSNTGRDILSPLPMFKQKDEYKDQDKDGDKYKDKDRDRDRDKNKDTGWKLTLLLIFTIPNHQIV